jgi:hypothetical protein
VSPSINDIQHNKHSALSWSAITLSGTFHIVIVLRVVILNVNLGVVILSVIMLKCCYAECLCVECLFNESHGAFSLLIEKSKASFI